MVECSTTSGLADITNTVLNLLHTWGCQNKLEFNPQKTTAMLVTKHRKFDLPLIYMNKVAIKLVDNFKYLGVILDKKLTFRPHFSYLETKSSKLLTGLSMAVRPTWGLNTQIMTTIYHGAVVPLLLYCVTAFTDILHYKWARLKLSQIQRGFLLRIIRAFRTISTEAALIIAGIEPLYLTALLKAQLINIKKGRELFMENSHIEMEEPATALSVGHPSIFPNIVIDELCENNHCYHIYTDGSLTYNVNGEVAQVGCAFVVYQNDIEIFSTKYKLAQYCTVFQAELLAIQEAVKWIVDNKTNARLYSDSQAALKAVNNKYCLNAMAVGIRDVIIQSGLHICMGWVKGHMGITGNERADLLAKAAAISYLDISDYMYTKCPFSYIKRSCKIRTIGMWNNQWVSSTTGELTKRLYFNTVFDRLKCRRFATNFVFTQFLSGHGKFGSYFERFRIRVPSGYFCMCKESVSSVPHLLFDCPVFTVPRFCLTLHLHSCNKDYRIPLNDILNCKCCAIQFMNFINRIFSQLRLLY